MFLGLRVASFARGILGCMHAEGFSGLDGLERINFTQNAEDFFAERLRHVEYSGWLP